MKTRPVNGIWCAERKKGRTIWSTRKIRASIDVVLARPEQPDRLVAFKKIQQMPQRITARGGKTGVAGQDQGCVVAGRGQELSVHLDPGDLEARYAALLGPEQVAFAAEPKVFLGDAKAVLGVAHDGEAGLGGFAER